MLEFSDLLMIALILHGLGYLISRRNIKKNNDKAKAREISNAVSSATSRLNYKYKEIEQKLKTIEAKMISGSKNLLRNIIVKLRL